MLTVNGINFVVLVTHLMCHYHVLAIVMMSVFASLSFKHWSHIRTCVLSLYYKNSCKLKHQSTRLSQGIAREALIELLFAMTSKSKITYYFQQAANPGKGVPRENDLNEHSKSVSTATVKESDVNEDTLELAVATSSGLGQIETCIDSLRR